MPSMAKEQAPTKHPTESRATIWIPMPVINLCSNINIYFKRLRWRGGPTHKYRSLKNLNACADHQGSKSSESYRAIRKGELTIETQTSLFL